MTFQYHDFVTNTLFILQVHKKSARGRLDMLNIFCLFVLHIRVATIIKDYNANFNDKFVFRRTCNS